MTTASLLERLGAESPLLNEVDTVRVDASDAHCRDTALTLAVLAHATSGIDGHMLVIGAGHGDSAVTLGVAARQTGRGRVFAVEVYPDPDEGPDAADWSLDAVLARVREAGLMSWVLPHHGTAATFARLMPSDFRCRLIHLESAQACQNVDTDLFLLEHLLAPGGWLTIGRGFTGFPAADAALEVFARQRDDAIAGWRQLTPGLLCAQKRTPS